MFYLLGDLFQLLFTPYKIPYVGFVLNWVFVICGILLLGFWLKNLLGFGSEKDKAYKGI
ncbi:MAG: hypothetical protein ACEQSF_04065 [Solirubrobacteraceae bacterium]